ncbi:hypothetical protein [Peribacillus kribbensis]|uniref:hypothetical protein n=1 Tax=Peribacillus kribbensis TaxID=356658 RepID=UPI0003FB0282|nr:hypothetical protein [Peribacillus kribbensis]
MMIIIICAVVALVLVFLLVRINSRAMSSQAEQPQVDPASQLNKDLPPAESREDQQPAADILAETVQPGRAQNNRPADDKFKMQDNGYRQALQNFKATQNNGAQPEKKQPKETSLGDDAYRKALKSMKEQKKD